MNAAFTTARFIGIFKYQQLSKQVFDQFCVQMESSVSWDVCENEKRDPSFTAGQLVKNQTRRLDCIINTSQVQAGEAYSLNCLHRELCFKVSCMASRFTGVHMNKLPSQKALFFPWNRSVWVSYRPWIMWYNWVGFHHAIPCLYL